MRTMCRQHISGFKAKVTLEALKGHKKLNELASVFSVHPVPTAQWKRQTQARLVAVFDHWTNRRERTEQELVEQLYQQIS